MDEKRKGEIALILLKYKIAKETISLVELKRELGNIAKAINVPLDELKEFFMILHKEILQGILNK